MNRVAVIVVNYNAGDLLHDCLAALAAQTVRPARVLVMDNGSSDGSVERCRADFGWAEFHLLNANVGFARANNIAAQMASDCEWLALLNPDAFPDRHWLESFLEGAQRYAGAHVFASCMLSSADPEMLDGAGDSYRVDGVAWPRFQYHSAAVLSGAPEEVFSPCAGAAFYRRRVFLEAGGFNERYFCYYEDVDLGVRLRLLGYRCWFLPKAVVHHVGSAVTGKGSDFSIYHVHRNMVWTYVRNMPGAYFWRYLPAHLLANLASLCVFVAHGRGRVVWRAKRDALRALPEVWRERREIQHRRQLSAQAVLCQMERGNVFSSVIGRAWRRVQRCRAAR